MSQRATLLVAAGLTVFILVLVGILAGRLSQGATTATPTFQAATADLTTGPLLAEMLEREAAYQQTIERVNQQLQEAYRQNRDLAAQLALIQATPAAPIQATPAAPITQEQATQAASAYLGGGAVTRVDLKRERRTMVYCVRFTDGSTVYVDATSGQVVEAKIEDEDDDHEPPEDDEEHTEPEEHKRHDD